MLGNIVCGNLEELSKGKGLDLLQSTFNTLISELANYLNLQPFYPNIIIKLKKEGKIFWILNCDDNINDSSGPILLFFYANDHWILRIDSLRNFNYQFTEKIHKRTI